MNVDKVKLIIHNMELLLTSLKDEINSSPVKEYFYENTPYVLDDYDEVFEE
jgi:hypothetical protein